MELLVSAFLEMRRFIFEVAGVSADGSILSRSSAVQEQNAMKTADMAARTGILNFFMLYRFSVKSMQEDRNHRQIIKKISRFFLFFILRYDDKIYFIMQRFILSYKTIRLSVLTELISMLLVQSD